MRLAVLCDYRGEGWPSMDLTSDMLIAALRTIPRVTPIRIQPRELRRVSRLARSGPIAGKADRFIARFLEYPTHVATAPRVFDAYHIADQSYAHLAFALPKGSFGVYCHDIDALRPALEGHASPLHVALSRVLLRGVKSARVVFHSTLAVREEILAHRVVDPERLVQAPFGLAPEFAEIGDSFPPPCEGPFVLHVGSLIPRKNPGFLLDLFAGVRERKSDVTLVQVGGEWTSEHLKKIHRHGLGRWIVQQRGISTQQLTDLYRRARCVLMPSRAEGFGLPMIEALACGATVIASDLPVLREVGGNAVCLAPLDDLSTWQERVLAALSGDLAPDPQLCRDHVQKYSWQRHAEIVRDAYLREHNGGDR